MTNSIASGREAARRGTRSFPGPVAAPFRALAGALMALASRRADAKTRQIEELNNLTDAELARRGLRRDDIIRYVFRGTAWM